jgi:hypothetical protein
MTNAHDAGQQVMGWIDQLTTERARSDRAAGGRKDAER